MPKTVNMEHIVAIVTAIAFIAVDAVVMWFFVGSFDSHKPVIIPPPMVVLERRITHSPELSVQNLTIVGANPSADSTRKPNDPSEIEQTLFVHLHQLITKGNPPDKP